MTSFEWPPFSQVLLPGNQYCLIVFNSNHQHVFDKVVLPKNENLIIKDGQTESILAICGKVEQIPYHAKDDVEKKQMCIKFIEENSSSVFRKINTFL
jgi:hypothetical protein